MLYLPHLLALTAPILSIAGATTAPTAPYPMPKPRRQHSGKDSLPYTTTPTPRSPPFPHFQRISFPDSIYWLVLKIKIQGTYFSLIKVSKPSREPYSISLGQLVAERCYYWGKDHKGSSTAHNYRMTMNSIALWADQERNDIEGVSVVRSYRDWARRVKIVDQKLTGAETDDEWARMFEEEMKRGAIAL
ncbi:MAG: hypothetical protein M1829_002684 [Trizodia sp. TS-e1964]|nr:MAG: hypothetical protein M1829_002684 [Trizodia sp. TS-e1964]